MSLFAGLFLECPGTTTVSLRATLKLISSPIQSLSIYDFDRAVVELPADIFADGVQVRHLQFSQSHLRALRDSSLRSLRPSLESLSIVNGKLAQVSYGVWAVERPPSAEQTDEPDRRFGAKVCDMRFWLLLCGLKLDD